MIYRPAGEPSQQSVSSMRFFSLSRGLVNQAILERIAGGQCQCVTEREPLNAIIVKAWGGGSQVHTDTYLSHTVLVLTPSVV